MVNGGGGGYLISSVGDLPELSGDKPILVYLSGDDPASYCLAHGIGYIDGVDLVELYDNYRENQFRLPELLATLGSCYASICVVGATPAADAIADFLANKSCEVARLDSDALSGDGSSYELSAPASEMTIIADVLPVHRVMRGNNPVNALFWVRSGSVELMDSRTDILSFILPALQDSGVHVLWAKLPWVGKLRSWLVAVPQTFVYSRLREKNHVRFVKALTRKFHTPELADELLDVRTLRSKGYAEMFHNGPRVNYDNGYRRTLGNKADYRRRVWMFGPCITMGAYVEDQDTIPAMLQAALGDEFLVINKGAPNGCGLNLSMRECDYRVGDLVIYMDGAELNRLDGYPVLDLIRSYDRIPRVYRHFGDSPYHCDAVVNRAIAEDLTAFVREHIPETDAEETDSVRFGSRPKVLPELYMINNPEFQRFCEEISPLAKEGNNGAIVMNCNPFTKGHLYLIEQAARQVDTLYIFVVEEDKSFFPFRDRFELVKAGTAHIDNVQVLASGSFIISSTTLPGYFTKDMIGDIYLDASNDLMLFLQIARVLNVSVRFAGEEPLDAFTAQYNRNMRTILKDYGMRFVEIPRKKDAVEVISASRVRALLKEEKWEEIRQLVPSCTYEYLRKLQIIGTEK